MQQRIYRVTGRVQGVFYRASTRDKAVALNITGHAINLEDGAVEVLACGENTALDQLAAWLLQGPPRAKVTQVELVATGSVDDPPRHFVTG